MIPYKKLKSLFIVVLLFSSLNIIQVQSNDSEKVIFQLSACSYTTEFGTYFFEGKVINEFA